MPKEVEEIPWEVLRPLFAITALHALIQKPAIDNLVKVDDAVRFADALIEKLKK